MAIRSLLLNRNGQPRDLVPIERAFSLLYEHNPDDGSPGRIEILLTAVDVDTDEIPASMRVWRSKYRVHPVPLVVRLKSLLDPSYDLPMQPSGRPSLQALIRRDEGRCLYCGRTGAELGSGNFWTIDHIVPRCQFPDPAEADTFTNTCLSCYQCNNWKGGRTPDEARMRLLKPLSEIVEPSKWELVEPGLLRCQREFVARLRLESAAQELSLV